MLNKTGQTIFVFKESLKMKINLKKKVMLALLAGGMLCMGQGSAENVNVWYGSGSPVAWKYVSAPYPFNLTDACKTGANFTIEDGTTVGGIALGNVQHIYGGYSGGTDLVTGNSITFNTTDTTPINAWFIHSGYSESGTAKGNSMTINGSTFSSYSFLYSGYSESGTAEGNSMTINGSTFSSYSFLYSGYSESGTAKGNSMTSNGGTFSSSSSLCSGYSESGTAEGNSMTINGGTLAGGAVCGYVDSGNGTVKGNLLTVNSGTFGGPIYGGYINSGNATAEDNLVIINGGTFNNSVYGGSGKSGDAKGNSLNINGGTFNYWIYSGRSDSGDAINNAVTIEDGIFNSNAIVSGGYSYGGKAGGTIPERGNKVTINGGTFNGAKISGATGDSSTAEGNNVTVNGGTFNSDSEIYGGDSYFGAVTNNTVTINGGIFDGTDIYGGQKHFSGTECVQGNKIVINGGTFGDNFGLYGGYTTGTSTNNTLNLKIKVSGKASEVKYFQNMNFTIPTGVSSDTVMLKSTAEVALSGVAITANLNGLSLTGNDYITLIENVDDTDFSETTNLKILDVAGTKCLVYTNGTPTAKGDYTIKQGSDKFDSGATGGPYSVQINGNTTDGGLSDTSYNGNEIIIRRGTYSGQINGAAYSGAGTQAVSGNKVTVYDGSFVSGSQILGGFTGSGNANNNYITINAGSFDNNDIGAGYTDSGNSDKNVVVINGGNFEGYSGSTHGIWGGYSDSNGSANENKVYVYGGTFSGGVGFWGGYNHSSGEANNNYVEINSGSFGNSAKIYGGKSDNGNALGNTLRITGGEIYAGTFCYGGYSVNGDANNNKVYFEGCSIIPTNGMLYIFGGVGDNGTANGNEIYILGDTDPNNYLYVVAGTGDTTAQGNNVYIGNEEATTVFNNLKFEQLVGGIVSSGVDITGNILHMRTAKCSVGTVGGFDTVNFTLPASIKNNDTILTVIGTLVVDGTGGTAKINVKAANGVKLNKDDVITLVDVVNTGTISDNYEAGDILGGAAEFYSEADAGEDKNGDGDQNDLIITLLQDFEQKKTAGNEDQQKAPVEGIAAAMQTVNMSADLASGQGMKSLVAETAGGFTNTFGAFTAGSSKYKTGSHVDVDGWGVLVGAGKTRDWKDGSATTYGLFFEYGKGDFDTYNGDVHGDGNSKNQGVGIMVRHKLTNNTYYEGNIRYGKQSTEWSESEIGSYDTDSKYYGIMVGMGHIFPAGKNEIDVYGRYTFGHVGACDATVGDSHYNFESVKSHRVRLGAKYNFVQEKSNAKPFIGLAWEHEFKGENKASISGVGEAPAPSMKGHTGLFELGCDWDVSKKWTLGLGANAYMGKRKGWDGTARVFYNF